MTNKRKVLFTKDGKLVTIKGKIAFREVQDKDEDKEKDKDKDEKAKADKEADSDSNKN